MLAEPFAESLQPCGQFRLVGRWLVAIIVSARRHSMHPNSNDAFVMHLNSMHPQRFQQDRGRSAAPEAARTILSGSGQVKKRRASVKFLTHMQISGVAQTPDSGQEGLHEGFSVHRKISAVLCRPGW
jgi:hypothetical protein